tara:strand:+ start:821 stop:1336 length:516 start_codon:yes stop_codon:yes gene_type:complete
METNTLENHKNLASLIHLSTFAKFFFPFGNFIAPLLLWTLNKEKSFVDEHGRQAVNFQLSILLYTLVIGLICLPFFVVFATNFVSLVETIDHHMHEVTLNDIRNISGYAIVFFVAIVFLLGLFVFELYAVITATIHAQRGMPYQYPLSIPFIKTNSQQTVEKNQSKNEHIS